MEGPGVLFKAFAVFALREIELTKVNSCENSIILGNFSCLVTMSIGFYHFQIESRPQRQRPLRVVDDSNEGSAK